MDILTTAKKYLKWFGILPTPVQNLPIRFRRFAPAINLLHTVLFCGGLLLYLLSLGHSLIFKAESHANIFMSAYLCTLTVMRVTLYFLMMRIRSELFVLIDDLEEVIKKSKQKSSLNS